MKIVAPTVVFVPRGSKATYLTGTRSCPLSVVEAFRNPYVPTRCRPLHPHSPAVGLKTPLYLPASDREQMSLVLKLIIDSGK